MLSSRHQTPGFNRRVLAAAVAIGAVAAALLAYTWPHNYDEGFNYFYFADRGFKFVATDYAYPNNHVLFTLVQALIPLRAIEVEPLLLRVPNILYSAALIGVLVVASRLSWSTPLRAVALIFAGPLTLQFYAQARGFQLGTLLVAAALLIAATRDEPWVPPVAAGLAVLATYAVPTFALGAPIFTVYYVARRRWLDAAAFTVPYLFVTWILYLPLIDQVISDRTNSFSTFRPFAEYTWDLLGDAYFLPVVLGLVLLLVGAWSWVRAAFDLSDESATTFLFIGYPLVFIVLAEAIQLVDFAASPFPRNGTFTAAFVLVGIWASPQLMRIPLLPWLIGLLLAANVLLGLLFHFDISGGSGITGYRGTFIGQTPRLGALVDESLDVTEVRCAWTDQWTCRLYESRFTDAGITMVYPYDAVVATECIVGSHRPRTETGIEVVTADGRLWLVCY